MGDGQLGEFIKVNRDEILRRCREKFVSRATPKIRDYEPGSGIPGFLDDLIHELGSGASKSGEMKLSATRHGADLFGRGFTIGQVVQDYGGVCQSVTDLALEKSAAIGTDDFRTLNRCLDDAIAMAVTEYAKHEHHRLAGDGSLSRSMTISNLVLTALLGFEALRSGSVGIGGSTGTVVHQCLMALRDLTVASPRKLDDEN